MKRKIALTLVLLLVAAGGIYMLSPVLGGLKFRNDKLERCSVSTGGGMLGGSSEYCLKYGDGGEVVLEVKYKETHADREKTDVYKASPEDLDRLAELAEKYGLYAASKRRYSRMRTLDGDTTTLSFDYSKDDFRISGEQVLSAKMRQGFTEAQDYLRSLAKGMCESYLEPQSARILIRGYNLHYVVEDAFDGKLDEILTVEREVSRIEDWGISLAPGEGLDTSSAQPLSEAAAGDMVYDSGSGRIVLLYAAHSFEEPAYLLAKLDGYVDSAVPLLMEMEGSYRMYLN